MINPCQPSPCGPYAQCQVINDMPSCSCLPEYRGSPPYCQPECISNPECPGHQSCVRQKCIDPCPNLCGENAECHVVQHIPYCVCSYGLTGDPYTRCSVIPCKKNLEKTNRPYIFCMTLLNLVSLLRCFSIRTRTGARTIALCKF